MKLAELVATSLAIGATPSRLAKAARLCACLEALQADEVAIAVAWLCGDLPQGKIGLGPAIVRSARPAVHADLPTLTIDDVHRVFDRIQATTGSGSQQERARLLSALLAAATLEEQVFLQRLVIGELRQGALAGVMVDALARVRHVDVDSVRRAVMLSGDLQRVAIDLLRDGPPALDRFRLQLFRPVQPMLAQPAEDVADALARLEIAALEYKLDGARIQVHRLGDEVRVFTRALNDVTHAVPEVVELVRALPADGLVLDGEVIALRPDGTPQPFQVTMSRFGRKLDIDAMRERLPLTAVFFDCLARDGDELFDRRGDERFAALAEVIPPAHQIPRLVTADIDAAQAFFVQAMTRGHEGLMAKATTAPYEAGGRGASWLKVKPAHSLDLVVLAAEWGSGRRKGWLSNLHLGAREPGQGFVMLGKTFKGLTDAMLEQQSRRFLELEVSRDAHTVYVRPEVVVEIAFNDVQKSPHYPGGMALRFARVKRYRPDKRAADADTIDAVRRIFAAQDRSA